MKSGSLSVAAGLAMSAGTTLAGLSPESVALVVNADSWASLTVANHYAHLRHIPESNIILLHGLTAIDAMGVDEVRQQIVGAVLNELDRRRFRDQIDCVTYSLDIPCAAWVNADMGATKFPQVFTPVASVNSLTYLYADLLRKDAAGYLGLDTNRYARRVLPVPSFEPMSPADQAQYAKGMALYDAKQYREAADLIASLVKGKRAEPGVLYNLACCQALAVRGEEAVATLRAAVAAGWRNHGQIASDPDFASVSSRDDFKQLLSDLRNAPVEIQPSRGFRASVGWTGLGEPSASGEKYLLSTFLGVASGRGNSVEEVIASLERSASADATSPPATIYFMKNGDVRSTTREWAFPFASKRLEQLGVKCVVENGVLPTGRKDVAGAVIGIADFDWPASKSTILPGAICEHLTSCGGMMGERDGQTPCTEFIRAGAAGTCGAVTEPYALQEKFPDPFIHVHYASGCTLAESFYQSLRGPYQMLIIGDPLCAPWSKAGRVAISGFAARTPASGEITIRAATQGGPGAPRSFQLFIDGVAFGPSRPTGEFPLDTRTLADGEHTISVVAMHPDPIETQSRGESTLRVANRSAKEDAGTGHEGADAKKEPKDGLRLTRKPPTSVVCGKPLKLELECPGAERVELYHFGRVVGTLEADSGSIDVDTTQLGLGPVQLRAVAVMSAAEAEKPARSVRGVPIRIEVQPPAPLNAGGVRGGGDKGLLLSVWKESPDTSAKPDAGARKRKPAREGLREVKVADTFDPAWIANAGVKEGEAFELEGVFSADAADLYQVQLRTNANVVVEIDGHEILVSDGPGWAFAPAKLGKGKHTLFVRGAAPKDPRLDLRLGAAGTARPSDRRFFRN